MRSRICAVLLMATAFIIGGCEASVRTTPPATAPVPPPNSNKEVHVNVPGVHVNKEPGGPVNVEVGRQPPPVVVP